MGRVIAIIVGIIAVLLGGLWLVQGLGLITVAPILCVAECEVLEGPSPMWAIIGFIVLVAGAGGLFYGTRRR